MKSDLPPWEVFHQKCSITATKKAEQISTPLHITCHKKRNRLIFLAEKNPKKLNSIYCPMVRRLEITRAFFFSLSIVIRKVSNGKNALLFNFRILARASKVLFQKNHNNGRVFEITWIDRFFEVRFFIKKTLFKNCFYFYE